MKVYVVLSMSGTKFSKMLKVVTRKEFTHASIGLDRELTELYSFGRRSMLMPIFAGFVHEEADKGVFDKYDPYCEVLELDVTKEQYLFIKEEIDKFFLSYSKYKYNFAGLPFMYLNVPYEREYHLVCSQFVAKVLSESKVYNPEKHWTLARPMEFYDIPNIKSIYKGRFKEYVYLNSIPKIAI